MKIIKKILKIIGWTLLVVIILAGLLLAYFNFPVKKVNDKTQLGVTFSHRYAQDINLDWKETYVAILDDLNVKKIRIPVYWDLVETKEGQYDFSDVEWQLDEAAKRNVEIILVVGQKVPRWPECAIPEWASQNDQKRKTNLLKLLKVEVEHFKNYPAIKYWQVENEPFLNFGICPEIDVNLLDAEIEVVRSSDPSRKILITDSGELSLWIQAAKRGDIFGTTMYRNVWNEKFGYFKYPIGPRFFHFKYWFMKLFTDQENVITVELQGEPWIVGWTTSASLEKQFESMNAEKLKDNILYARQVGFSEIYIWGAEWWYWLKTQMNYPLVWETAKEEFSKSK